MDVRVAGHQVETGESLQEHVSARIEALADRYFARSIGANVTFGKGPHDNGFTCDIVAPVAQGLVLKASNRAAEAKIAFEGAADKIEKQLRRYTRRLKDRKGANDDAAAIIENAGYTVFAPPAEPEQEEQASENPAVIAETRVDIPDASVADAVMMLDLRNTNALMFRNANSGEYNMVYRRDDGTIGWVEPSAS